MKIKVDSPALGYAIVCGFCLMIALSEKPPTAVRALFGLSGFFALGATATAPLLIVTKEDDNG